MRPHPGRWQQERWAPHGPGRSPARRRSIAPPGSRHRGRRGGGGRPCARRRARAPPIPAGTRPAGALRRTRRPRPRRAPDRRRGATRSRALRHRMDTPRPRTTPPGTSSRRGARSRRPRRRGRSGDGRLRARRAGSRGGLSRVQTRAVPEASRSRRRTAVCRSPVWQCTCVSATATDTTTIRLDGLTKSFAAPAGPVHAVRGIDVEIRAGETVALLGPNGAGKSTTIDMLLGLLPPDSGSVSVFGRSPTGAIAQGAIGAMLQTGSLIRDLSVRELLDMMASLYPRPLGVDEVIDLAGIGEIAARRTQRLSGGETQRARFAVALVSNPALLVLDEPTVAMDVESRHAFWTTMRAFAARGKTIVFATHYLEEADEYADRAILLSQGVVVADGPTTEIKAMVS